MLNKLLCIPVFLSLFAISSFHFPARAYVKPPPASPNAPFIAFEVTPTGPLNLGDRYEIKAVVTLDGKNPCQNCPIRWKFLEDPQPGDELTPYSNKTNTDGEASVNATAYAVNPETGYRELSAEITLPTGSIITSSPIQLQYNNKPLLGFVRLVTDLVKKGYVLPPVGNVYPKALKQVYIGGQTREIFLEWNRPFGARRFDIFTYEGELFESEFGGKYIKDSATGQNAQPRLIKIAYETQTSVTTPVFQDIQIRVDACTTGDSCVGPMAFVTIPRITDSVDASQAGELSIPNYGLEKSYGKYDEQLQEEQGLLQKLLGPVMGWLKGIYSLFK